MGRQCTWAASMTRTQSSRGCCRSCRSSTPSSTPPTQQPPSSPTSSPQTPRRWWCGPTRPLSTRRRSALRGSLAPAVLWLLWPARPPQTCWRPCTCRPTRTLRRSRGRRTSCPATRSHRASSSSTGRASPPPRIPSPPSSFPPPGPGGMSALPRLLPCLRGWVPRNGPSRASRRGSTRACRRRRRLRPPRWSPCDPCPRMATRPPAGEALAAQGRMATLTSDAGALV
mmetsp:Transcript_1294/g.4064  ORF Transcript_1294/g.4064 Transcript_1294/m.4064 type:complete len:227 (+) Transcript_1294:559-1239(+)